MYVGYPAGYFNITILECKSGWGALISNSKVDFNITILECKFNNVTM